MQSPIIKIVILNPRGNMTSVLWYELRVLPHSMLCAQLARFHKMMLLRFFPRPARCWRSWPSCLSWWSWPATSWTGTRLFSETMSASLSASQVWRPVPSGLDLWHIPHLYSTFYLGALLDLSFYLLDFFKMLSQSFWDLWIIFFCKAVLNQTSLWCKSQ